MNYKHELAKRLKELINTENISAFELSKLLVKPNSTIYRWLNAEALPKIDEIKKICELFNIDPRWLVLGHSAMYNSAVLGSPKMRAIPLYNTIEDLVKSHERMLYSSILDIRKNNKIFASIRMNSDEMNPTVQPGDVCILSHPSGDFINRIAIISVGSAFHFRRIALYEKTVVLVADNPQYKTIQTSKEKFDILGIVESINRNI